MELREHVLKISGGFLTATADVLLCWLFMTLDPPRGRSPRAVYEAVQRADKRVGSINYEVIRRSFYYLKQKGLIVTAADKLSKLTLSEAGKKRIAQKFPVYLTARPWDKKIYLVTYDIPETHKKQRDLLRDYLRRLGCAMYQRSVWVSAYDPRGVLQEWAKLYGFEDAVVVSDVGQDGSIGGKTIIELIDTLYDLGSVDREYRLFIDKYGRLGDSVEVNQWQLNLDWAGVVEVDPQLPFSLLPSGFSGDRAYSLYRSLEGISMEDVMKGSSPWEESERKHVREQARRRRCFRDAR